MFRTFGSFNKLFTQPSNAPSPSEDFSSTNEKILSNAVVYGDIVTARNVIDKINVNNVECFASTVLMVASYIGNNDMVELLLDNNADINFSDKTGTTALISALNGSIDNTDKENNIKTLFTLISRGADLNSVDPTTGVSPLIMAIKLGRIDLMKLMLQNGADLFFEDDNGYNILKYAQILGTSCSKNYQEIINVMLEYEKLLLPLHAAIKIYDMPRFLHHVEFEDINKRDLRGITPLMLAAELGYEDILVRLLFSEADINIIDNDGKTALFYAVKYNHYNIVRKLIDNGADITIRCIKNKDVMILSAEAGNIRMVKILLEHGADVNAKLSNNRTILSIATHNNNIDLVRLLVSQGATVNIIDTKGNTPLLIATQQGNVELVNLLLESKANINYVNPLSQTAIMITLRCIGDDPKCSDRRYIDILNLLYNHKISMKERNFDEFSHSDYENNHTL